VVWEEIILAFAVIVYNSGTVTTNPTPSQCSHPNPPCMSIIRVHV